MTLGSPVVGLQKHVEGKLDAPSGIMTDWHHKPRPQVVNETELSCMSCSSFPYYIMFLLSVQ